MAYRDDNEALRARVAELERKLALSEALVERLMGRGGGTATRKPDSLVGEVVHRVDETSLDVTLDAAGLASAKRLVEARLAHLVKERDGVLEGWRTQWAFLAEREAPAFGLATNEHGTSLRLETDLRRLPVLVTLGPVLGTLLAMPLVAWQWNELHHFRETVSMATSFSVVMLTMVLGTVASRSFARRLAKRANELHQGVWAALLEVTRAHAQLPRVRVTPADDEGERRPSPELDERASTPAPLRADEASVARDDAGRVSRPSRPRASATRAATIRRALRGLTDEPDLWPAE
jgi:hypothetical protein